MCLTIHIEQFLPGMRQDIYLTRQRSP